MAVGSAIIGGALALGGSVLSSKSNKKAAQSAADTSQANNAANNALAREIYGKNQQVLSPFVNRGNAAGNQINALLGIGGGQPAAAPTPNALSQFRGGVSPTDYYGLNSGGFRGAGSFLTGTLSGYDPVDSSFSTPRPQNTLAPASSIGVSAGQAQNDAFDTFRNSTGYQFRLGEGLDALNSGFAGSGTLQSGDAMRSAIEYGQNFASNEFGNYLNALGSQQAVGAGTASSLAGVGQNFAGTVINSNNQNAANVANAQLVQGANNPFANALGTIGGTILGGGFG